MLAAIVIKVVIFLSVLSSGCINQPTTYNGLPDFKRIYVEKVSGAGLVEIRPWVRLADIKETDDGLFYIDGELIEQVPVEVATPDEKNFGDYCFKFSVSMKTRQVSEPVETDMKHCDQSVKEMRCSALAFNIWFRKLVWNGLTGAEPLIPSMKQIRKELKENGCEEWE